MTGKELINEIESKIAWNDMNIDETSVSLRDVKRLLNELEKQTERVQELELEVNDWRDEVKKWQRFYEESEESNLETMVLLRSTLNQNKRYREAINNINEKAMLFGTNEEVYDAIQDAIKVLEGEE